MAPDVSGRNHHLDDLPARQSHTYAGGNTRTGDFNSATTRSGETANGAKGGSVTTDPNGNVNHTAAGYNPNTGRATVAHDGNVYSNKDGNVYRHTDSGGWQGHDNHGWQNTEHHNSDLDRQSHGWQQGNDRFHSNNGGRWGGGRR